MGIPRCESTGIGDHFRKFQYEMQTAQKLTTVDQRTLDKMNRTKSFIIYFDFQDVSNNQ